MIILTEISVNGAPVSIAPTSFDELGGSIGRADTNQMVLPDTGRTISRIHAQIVFRSGKYALIDRGSNAVLHNGMPVGNGREVFLAAGDEIQIGGYRIAVSEGSAVKSDDPFAAFDSENARVQSPVNPKSQAGFSAPVARVEVKVPPRPSGMQASAPPGHRSMTGIPDDWDPFRPDQPVSELGDEFRQGAVHGTPASQTASSGSNDGMPELSISVPAHEQSLDSLFGLTSGAPIGDPLAGSALSAPLVQPNTSADANPLRSLQMPADAAVNTEHDHDSDLQAPWHNAPVVEKAPPRVASALPGVVLSWDQTERMSRTTEQLQKVEMPVELDVGALNDVPNLTRNSSKPEAVPSVNVPQAMPPTLDALSNGHELMQAFLDGLGVPDLRVQPLTTDTLYQLGQLLRESTKGTIELLAARTALKKEVRVEVTVMSPTANNALKFSPTVEYALQYLLGPKTMGFMGPVESVRDAFDDLKAHQVGIMAGMRVALSDVLHRFDPAMLEGKLAKRSTLESLMPSGRKAKLWELFQNLFGQLANEAEEDFDELFGKSFAREYERYVAQINDRST